MSMPLYVYQVVEADGSEGEVFEVLQRISEDPLTVHPENGKPVVRIISAPNAVTRFGGGNLSNDRLGKLGFTKYQKAGGGFYEKTAGDGPDVIKG
jgi:predicted nucleic acid-binding Zn ribbon protein